MKTINNFFLNNKGKLFKLFFFLFASLYIALPNYFSFKIPLIPIDFTASRLILILCLVLFLIYFKKIPIPKSKLMIYVYIYICLIIFVDVVHLTDAFSYSVKNIIMKLLEEVGIVCIVSAFVKDKHDMNLFVKVLVFTSLILGILSIISFISEYNLFYLLKTATGNNFQTNYERLGMIRAESSFNHPVYYGAYCMCMLPFCLFLHENTNKKIYLFTGIINILCVILSGSRGSIILTIVLLSLMFICQKRNIMKKYVKYILMFVFMFILLFLAFPKFKYYTLGNFYSIISMADKNTNINDELLANYGSNIKGVESRVDQLSGLQWLLKNNAIVFGLGTNCAERRLIAYYYQNRGWSTETTIDIGYIGWLLNYGIIGFYAYGILFCKLFFYTIKHSNNSDTSNLCNAFKWFIVSYLLCLTTCVGVNKLLWVIIGLIISYDQINKKSKNIN